MIKKKSLRSSIYFLMVVVWLFNGLFAKILNIVPRHQEIISQIMQVSDARLLTIVIGLLEIVMLIWIMSNFRVRINAVVQIVVVLTMNVIELVMVPELLLWGVGNFIFSLVYAFLVYYYGFVLTGQD